MPLPEVLPLTLCWSPPPAPGRTLFMVLAYHGRDRDATPGWWERFESPAARGHRLLHRDHYANPRSLDYQMALVASAGRQLTPHDAPDVVVDAPLAAAADGLSAMPGVVVADILDPAAWGRPPLADSARYDHVVLVYADALGLGCERAEKRALRGRRSVLVVNGRRRAFRLTRLLRARVQVSRVLARTRAVERALAVGVRPLAHALAAWDRWAERA